MERESNEIADTERFNALYEVSQTSVMEAVIQDVCGCGYLGTSWTTLEEADLILQALGLDATSSLLDLGAGAGWPGLYLAKQSGCRITLLDLPETGLRIATERAEADGMSDRLRTVVANAAEIPLGPGSFTAVNHSDLLCCLIEKEKVLEECRRLIAPTGRMTFSVISIAPDLSNSDRTEAIENGPSFIEAARGYMEMLQQTGWRVLKRADVTTEYQSACERLLQADQRYQSDLIDLLGAEEVAERLEKWQRKLSSIKRRLMIREFFLAAPD